MNLVEEYKNNNASIADGEWVSSRWKDFRDMCEKVFDGDFYQIDDFVLDFGGFLLEKIDTLCKQKADCKEEIR